MYSFLKKKNKEEKKVNYNVNRFTRNFMRISTWLFFLSENEISSTKENENTNFMFFRRKFFTRNEDQPGKKQDRKLRKLHVHYCVYTSYALRYTG